LPPRSTHAPPNPPRGRQRLNSRQTRSRLSDGHAHRPRPSRSRARRSRRCARAASAQGEPVPLVLDALAHAVCPTLRDPRCHGGRAGTRVVRERQRLLRGRQMRCVGRTLLSAKLRAYLLHPPRCRAATRPATAAERLGISGSRVRLVCDPRVHLRVSDSPVSATSSLTGGLPPPLLGV